MTTLAELPDFLTVSETAQLMRCGETAIQDAINRGEIPTVRVGHRTQRIPKAALATSPLTTEALLSAQYVIARDRYIAITAELAQASREAQERIAEITHRLSQAEAEGKQAWRAWQSVREAASTAA